MSHIYIYIYTYIHKRITCTYTYAEPPPLAVHQPGLQLVFPHQLLLVLLGRGSD